ncbi:putative ABC transporter permease [Caproiciproducens sp.]
MKKNAFLFLTGGAVYPALEMICRGKTDISMAAAGGLCLCLIDRVCNHTMRSRPISVKCFAGSGIITTVEFVTGLLVNVVLKQDVWDYSALPLNIMGQICVPFSLLWCVVTLPAMGLCGLCEKASFLAE